MSKGEELITRILTQNHIKFISEKTFTDLRAGRFRYDFYCPNLNGEAVIIEYNGEQHYYLVNKFHKTRADFTKGQEHDRRKISYALANKIKIICIPFWEKENISSLSDILQDKFIARSRWHNDECWRRYNKK